MPSLPPRACRFVILGLALAASLGNTASDLKAQEEPPKSKAEAVEKSEGEVKEENQPSKIGKFLDPINVGRLQRLFDRAVGLDAGDVSNRPEVPEFGEPVFFDLTRPLGDPKYSNETNYLLNPSTRNAPTLQVIEYEYTFTDWRAAELDLSYYNGNLEVLTPFYQRTLGVSKRKNWAHGYQVSPDIYIRSGFVGGSAVYIYAWKPEEESRFSTMTFVGANRTLIGGFHPSPMSLRFPVGLRDKTYGSWRPTINFDVFYSLSEKVSLGIETDLFIQTGRASEYFSFPFVTYKPSQRFFVQLGGGYYHFESRDQLTFLAHLNFVNPSNRKPREEPAREESTPEPVPERGPIRRCLARLMGDQ